MELRISNHVLDTYNQVRVHLKYDSVADTFSFRTFFDPENRTHRELFRPGSYHKCTITHGGVLVMTGTVLSPRFGSSARWEMPDISGYSTPGILGDSCVLGGGPINSLTAPIPPGSLEMLNLNLEQIAIKLSDAYAIKVVVDPEVSKDPAFSVPYPKVPVKPSQTVCSVLDELCLQKNVVLSHTKKGELLITRAKSDAKLTTSTTIVRMLPTPVSGDVQGSPSITATRITTTQTDRAILHDFTDPGQWTNMNLEYNGQALHKVIQVVGQDGSGNSLDSYILNPLVDDSVRRYKRVIQTSGTESDTKLTARGILNDELKNIVLTIEIQGWTLNGNLVTPNQMITVTNPDCHLYKKTKWFIQEVILEGDEKKDKATLVCVLPFCFNNDPITNVFA